MNNKKWTLACLFLTLFLLVLGALPTVIADPYIHYHKPLAQMTLILNNQRYQNDGILKNFDYEAIVTGTSMTENFKTSEVDSLFDVDSIKVSYSGASFKEIADSMNNAFRANPNIHYVIRAIDCNRIIEHKDAMNYDVDMYPTYLYDWNPFNDVSYVFNKQILFEDTMRVWAYSRAGIPSTTFDEYSYWADDYEYGAEAVLKDYARPEKLETVWTVQPEEIFRLQESMIQNFISHAEKHPDTQFYYFFAPYSIYWWDSIHQVGETERYIQLMEVASRMMVEYDNIHLFSFFDVENLICEPDHYKDTLHYSGEINSQILQWMKNGEHRLTRDNYKAHWDAMREFYENYDYDALFE